MWDDSLFQYHIRNFINKERNSETYANTYGIWINDRYLLFENNSILERNEKKWRRRYWEIILNEKYWENNVSMCKDNHSGNSKYVMGKSWYINLFT